MKISRFSAHGIRTIALVVTALLPLAAPLRADHQDFVIVNASASPAYVQRKFINGTPQQQTYIFFQGKTFAGETRDSSIDHASFDAIVHTLAPDLAKQNYLPAQRAPGADLLIVVNWGTTVTDPTQDNSHNPEPKMAPRDSYMADALWQSRRTPMSYNSFLLGYDSAIKQEGRMNWATPSGMNAMEESHLAELIDERYFVILMAYDYQTMLRENLEYRQALRNLNPREARRLPRPQPRPVWSVRMNMRSAGNNFNEALPAMSMAASQYFGKQVEDLVDAPAAVGSNAHVKVGETKVLNVVK